MSVILGIDPGSRITGFGVIDLQRSQLRHIASGSIDVAELPFEQRLVAIFDALTEVVRRHQPQVAAIEKVFMNRNVDSTLKLGQARGVAMVAVAKRQVPLHEYSPNQIKQAIVGRGHAEKAQMQHMIKVLLALEEAPAPDAADALAVAVCHGHTQQGLIAVRSSRGRRAGRYL